MNKKVEAGLYYSKKLEKLKRIFENEINEDAEIKLFR